MEEGIHHKEYLLLHEIGYYLAPGILLPVTKLSLFAHHPFDCPVWR